MKRAGELRSAEPLQKKKVAPTGLSKSSSIPSSFSLTVPATAVFPQLAGLGSSPAARRYAISGAAEARAFLADPELAWRLRQCCNALLALPTERSAQAVLGSVDALKLRSSMTLFAAVAGNPGDVFHRVLARFYGGEADPATLRLLGRG